MPTETMAQYEGFVRSDAPIPIWTPDGEYNAPMHIAEADTPVSMDFFQAAKYMRNLNQNQRHLTCGELYQASEHFIHAVPYVSGLILNRSCLRTGTLLDYDHGLLVQFPEFDEDEFAVGSGGIIKAGEINGKKQVWEMALPRKSCHLNGAPADLKTFFNTIYGMEDAAMRSSEYAYFMIGNNPTGIRNLMRGDWYFDHCRNIPVRTYCISRPSASRVDIASRGALDI